MNDSTVNKNRGVEIRGTVSVVTGGTRGIGKATALKLAELGSDIAIIYNNKG